MRREREGVGCSSVSILLCVSYCIVCYVFPRCFCSAEYIGQPSGPCGAWSWGVYSPRSGEKCPLYTTATGASI